MANEQLSYVYLAPEHTAILFSRHQNCNWIVENGTKNIYLS